MKIKLLISAIGIATMLVSCKSTSHTVTRVNPDQTIDLSGRWNDSDSRLAADALIDQVLNERWLSEFMRANNNERPVVIAGVVRNKSHEHIDAETFVKDIEKAFIRTGRVRLVQAGEKREEIRRERADQQDYSSAATMKKWGQEVGADFMMQGTINSIVDSYNNEKVVYYQIDLELTNLETNEVVWIGDKKIKKVVQN